MLCLTGDEFRKYIINSDINGTVQANDKNVFHHNNWSLDEHLQFNLWFGDSSNDTIYNGTSFSANSMDANCNFIAGGGYDIYRLISFRPVMEYVDNPKSTNIYY